MRKNNISEEKFKDKYVKDNKQHKQIISIMQAYMEVLHRTLKKLNAKINRIIKNVKQVELNIQKLKII